MLWTENKHPAKLTFWPKKIIRTVNLTLKVGISVLIKNRKVGVHDFFRYFFQNMDPTPTWPPSGGESKYVCEQPRRAASIPHIVCQKNRGPS